MARPSPPRQGLDVNPDRWPEVSRVFSAALGLEGSARHAYLEDACAYDPALRAAVDSMLDADAGAGSFGEGCIFPPAAVRRLEPGGQLGTFRIEALLGSGGMGEVYRAHDTKLRRDVAIKVLPDSVANDPDRRSRFEEEAQALAALNHPNIGAIYGVEESGGVAALVLELVDGPMLAERLTEGPLPFQEIARIARQLAEALEAAHDRGIVHRDLKPGNIKITLDGDVKILDFGLAKADVFQVRAVSADSPATSRRATVVGAIVGTPAYMSPEQARGLAVDRRTDIWAFGCVLFEMCAGQPAFPGATVGDTLHAVIEREPAWAALPATTPATLVRLLRRCLTKDAKLRLRDIGEARIALAPGQDADAAERRPPSARRRAAIVAGTALAIAASAAAVVLYRQARSTPAPTPTTARFEVPPPAGSVLQFHPARPPFAVSPDGSQLAFVTDESPGTRRPRIWLRAMAGLESRPVPGTDGAFGVFWSPDGRSLAFFSDDALKRVDLPAGPPVTICALSQARFSHLSWGAANQILIGSGSGTEIRSVPAAGGRPRVVVAANRSNREVRVHWPSFLPDGNRFLYTARLDDGEGELRLGQLDGTTRPLMRASSNAQWVDPDLVVFAREGVLLGQRVDLEAARPIGEPFVVADDVEYFLTTSRAMFSVSRTGALAYHPGGGLQQLLWVDGNGNQVGTVGDLADYHENSSRLSRDGSKLLVARYQEGLGTADLWQLDLVRKTQQRLTTNRGTDMAPVWSGDERTIFYSADSPGTVPHLFRMDLTTGASTQLLPAGLQQHPVDVFPGDRALLYTAVTDVGGWDIFQKPLIPDGPPTPLLQSRQSTWIARMSPDGHRMAYISEADGRLDIYVAPLPVTSAPELVAQGVAGPPRWSMDGRHLYFVSGDRMMRVAVGTVPRLNIGTPRPLFALKHPASSLFVVSPDGRFLLSVPHVRAAERPIVVATAAFAQAAP